ncbi:hypothetical protein PsorP6_014532 [Peronosclerospora sorghi]|uniref:Uncharacterized protein n=1 Tax=Peronosclerospora sorghi TaxID=230839 RepID=A0ACC0VSL8_9STRA|nr:hypothetical protein PsorP6_014532 [Peronosclerospora sorghi]
MSDDPHAPVNQAEGAETLKHPSQSSKFSAVWKQTNNHLELVGSEMKNNPFDEHVDLSDSEVSIDTIMMSQVPRRKYSRRRMHQLENCRRIAEAVRKAGNSSDELESGERRRKTRKLQRVLEKIKVLYQCPTSKRSSKAMWPKALEQLWNKSNVPRVD